MFKYGVFSGPYSPIFGPEKPLYLATSRSGKLQLDEVTYPKRSVDYRINLRKGSLHCMAHESAVLPN